MVAILVFSLLHTPEKDESLNSVVVPAHIVVVPVITEAMGNGLIDIKYVAVAVLQLLVTVYNNVSVPGIIPVTSPELLIVAIFWFRLLQVPSVTVSVRDVVAPVHRDVDPVITPANGCGFTIIEAVSAIVPQLFAIV